MPKVAMPNVVSGTPLMPCPAPAHPRGSNSMKAADPSSRRSRLPAEAVCRVHEGVMEAGGAQNEPDEDDPEGIAVRREAGGPGPLGRVEADADRQHRLAERDQQYQPVPLHEVPRDQLERRAAVVLGIHHSSSRAPPAR